MASARVARRQCGFDGVHVHRLDEVMVEACLSRPLAIRLLSVPCDGDQMQILQSGHGPEMEGQFVAVHDRQAEVEKRDVRRELRGHPQRGRRIICHSRFVAAPGEDLGQQLRPILIVIDDEDARRAPGRSDGLRALRRCRDPRGVLLRPCDRRQTDDEFASLPRPLAARRD